MSLRCHFESLKRGSAACRPLSYLGSLSLARIDELEELLDTRSSWWQLSDH
jgi:hypothetical protein